MDDTTDREPTMQELQARMREMVSDIRRSVEPEARKQELKARTPRQTIPLAEERHRHAS